MADAKAKTINLLLYEGDLEGVISIEDSSWNSGELYSAPRDSVSELLETDACKKYGVYLLLSKSMVYVGQSSDLSKRITQHTVGKDWWESVVILTTKDDSLKETARLTDSRRELSDGALEQLNTKLNYIQEHLDEQPEVTITYFQADSKKSGGAYLTCTGIVKRVDDHEHTVLMQDGREIFFNDITEIGGSAFQLD